MDLERSVGAGNSNDHVLEHVIVREASVDAGISCRTVCEYGMTPRQIFCGLENQIKLCDLRSGAHMSTCGCSVHDDAPTQESYL